MHKTLNPENTILIACSMMEDEIGRVLQEKNLQYPVVWMERGYHSYPDKLRAVLQEQIDLAEKRLQAAAAVRPENAGTDEEAAAESGGRDIRKSEKKDDGESGRNAEEAGGPAAGNADKPVILLAYGLCGNGAERLKADSSILAMPRFDDCINTLLCCDPRSCRALEKAGVYYLTRGWTQDTGALLQSHQELLDRFGEKKTARIMNMMYDGYKEVAVIDDGCYDTAPIKQYAQECADLLKVKSGSVPGGTYILEKLLTGNWDDDILVKQPGEAVAQEDFFWEKF